MICYWKPFPCADPTFSSLPALPLTLRYRSPSQVDAALLTGLEEIRCGNAVPLSSLPSSSHSSVPLYSDSDHTSIINGCQAYRLVGGKKAYDSSEEVAAYVRHLGKQQNNCLDEIVSLKGEIQLLKAVIAQPESDSVAHEAELMIGRGEPVWSWRERIRESVRAEAAKRMNGDVTPSPPPNDTGVASSSGGRKVAFDESPDAGFVEVGKKKFSSRKANRLRRDQATRPTTATGPDPVLVTVPELSPRTSAAMYSLLVAAPPPPPVPHMTRPGLQVQSRLV